MLSLEVAQEELTRRMIGRGATSGRADDNAAVIVRRIEETGADGIELNYGCPHGMSERGMGSAVGQVPGYCEEITRWVKKAARIR